MLWALLFYYLFGTGHENLLQDLSKPIQQCVRDEAKAKQLIELNKAMVKAAGAYSEEQKKALKKLAELNQNRSTPESEFLALHAALEQQRIATRAQVVEGRFQMLALMTPEQWQAIHAEPSPAK
jgi:Spy/CpxP family protein refolding chaperone